MIRLGAPFFPGRYIETRPWWQLTEPTRSGRLVTPGVYRRTDGLCVVRDGDHFLSHPPPGVAPIRGVELISVLAQVDKAYPMPHPGIRPGQLWRLEWPQTTLDVVVERSLTAWPAEAQGGMKPASVCLERWGLSGLHVSAHELRTLLDPRRSLPWDVPDEGVLRWAIKVLPLRVVLLSDPHFPHLAPFFAEV